MVTYEDLDTTISVTSKYLIFNQDRRIPASLSLLRQVYKIIKRYPKDTRYFVRIKEGDILALRPREECKIEILKYDNANVFLFDSNVCVDGIKCKVSPQHYQEIKSTFPCHKKCKIELEKIDSMYSVLNVKER